jgi:hypothetical protein
VRNAGHGRQPVCAYRSQSLKLSERGCTSPAIEAQRLREMHHLQTLRAHLLWSRAGKGVKWCVYCRRLKRCFHRP